MTANNETTYKVYTWHDRDEWDVVVMTESQVKAMGGFYASPADAMTSACNGRDVAYCVNDDETFFLLGFDFENFCC